MDENLRMRIAEDCDVHVFFRGTVTQEAIEKFIALLQISIDAYPRKTLITGKEQP